MQDCSKQLLKILLQSNPIREILTRAPELNLPHWHLGAGCIAQTVWNHFHGYELTAHIKDCDLVYFDTDLSEEKEQLIGKQVKEKFAHVPLELDVANQARVHLLYEDYFGYPVKPYRSIEEAISTWPTTATCVGISKTDQGFHVYAPYGLDDLMSLVVRANKKQITEAIYIKKVERWCTAWPQLIIVSWADNQLQK